MSLKTLLMLALAGSIGLLGAAANAQENTDTSTLVTYSPKEDGGALIKFRDGAGPSLDPIRNGNWFDPVRWLVVEPITDLVVDNPYADDPLVRVHVTHGTVELTTEDYFAVEVGLTVPWDTEPQDPYAFLQTHANNTTIYLDGVAIGTEGLPAVADQDTPDMCASGGLEYPCGFDYYYNFTMQIKKPGTYHLVETSNAFEPYWSPDCAPDEACIPPNQFEEEWTLHVAGGHHDH